MKVKGLLKVGMIAVIFLWLVGNAQPRQEEQLPSTSGIWLSPFVLPVGRTPLIAARGGRLYFLDDFTNRLFICDRKGVVTRTVGSIGSGPGQFYRPAALAVTARSIVVYDKGNSRVEFLSLDGTFQGDFALGPEIFSLAAGDDGLVYINEPSAGYLIEAVNDQGKIVKKFGSLASVSALYRSPDKTRDNQYRLQSNRVRLAADDLGHVYAAFVIAPILREYSSDGSLVREVALSGETAKRLADAFWQGPGRETRMVSGIIDGKQVPFLIKDITVDPVTHHVVLLTAFSTVYLFESGGRQISCIKLQGAPDWQLWRMAVEGRSLWFVKIFVPGSLRGEFPEDDLGAGKRLTTKSNNERR